jgi:hypothetical protein
MTSAPPPSFSPGRKWNITLNTVLLVLSVVALLAMVNYLVARHSQRFDWSGSGRIELSPRTRQVLASVTNEVKVILYFDRREPLFKMSLSLLKAYAEVNPRLVIETIDYTRDTSAALAAKSKYKLIEKSDRDLIIFECQGRSKPVFQSELSDLDLNDLLAGRSSEVKRIAFKGEMQFTSALLAVITPRQPKAYFLQGHGEHKPDSDEGLMGYSKFAGVLKENSVLFDKLEIKGSADIPADCNLLIIAGPHDRFLPDVLEKIDRYLRQGGRLLALFNYRTAIRATGLERTVGDWGVVVGGNYAFDDKNAVNANKQDMVITIASGHRLMKPLLDSQLYLLLPRAISRDTTLGRGSDAPQVEEIASTSAEGRLVTEIRPDGSYSRTAGDYIGAVPLIVAVESGGVRGVVADRGATRLVVAGDSVFLANDTIDKAANRDFAHHAINWLLAREDMLVAIPARPLKEYKLAMSRAQMRNVQWILLAGMPGTALLLGALVWLRRRR